MLYRVIVTHARYAYPPPLRRLSRLFNALHRLCPFLVTHEAVRTFDEHWFDRALDEHGLSEEALILICVAVGLFAGALYWRFRKSKSKKEMVHLITLV